MLNHSDYYIKALQFPYEAECPWAIKVTFIARKSGKKSEGIYAGKDGWMKVAEQCRRQIGSAEYISVSHEPKPKKRAVESAPIIGKGKGKPKKKAA